MIINKWGKSGYKVVILALLVTVFVIQPWQIAVSASFASDSYEQVAASGQLVLYANVTTGAIAVEDRRTGHVWRSVLEDDMYDLSGENRTWRSNMSSLITIVYTNLNATREQVLTKAYSTADTTQTNVAQIANGIAVTYDFTKAGIQLTLEMELLDDSIIVRIPADQIVHRGNNGLVSVELMPFFGASGEGVGQMDGYMMYPDGSGALTHFDMKSERPRDVRGFKLPVYSASAININEQEVDSDVKYQAMLPVFGMKVGNNAFLAAGMRGEEDSTISVNPDGFMVPLNRIWFELNYRHMYNVTLSNITVRGTQGAVATALKADKAMIASDREIRIWFLVDDEAHYSGMANRYRQHLLDQGLLQRIIHEGDQIPLGLDLFMGIVEERMLWDKYIPMTTYKAAEQIVEQIKQAGVGQIELILKGWMKGGYGKYPLGQVKTERKLGGEKSLKQLAEFTSEQNIKLYLANDYLLVDSKARGLNSKKHVAKEGSNLSVATIDKSRLLVNPITAMSRAASMQTMLDQAGGGALAVDQIGQMIYHDYNKVNPMSRTDTKHRWRDLLEAAVQSNQRVAVDGGNQYVLSYASRLYNIPLQSSKNRGSDEDIPFFQMVVHGSIPYSSMPGNLSYDLQLQKLKWVEFGSMPHFELTGEPSVLLKKTAYNKLFSSYYIDWVQRINEIMDEFNERLSSTWNQAMVSHERLNSELVKVTYQNGDVVYINYGETSQIVGDHHVQSMDYTVVEAGDHE